MIHVVRLVRTAFCPDARSAFLGEGAAIYGGRWNRKGERMCYAASSRSLAALEILANIDRRLAPTDYAFATAHLEDADLVRLGTKLPPDWRTPTIAFSTVSEGHNFLAGKVRLALAVPSVIIPQESNYLINPEHPRFSALQIDPTLEPFSFDSRLIAL